MFHVQRYGTIRFLDRKGLIGWQCRLSVTFLKIDMTDQPAYIKQYLEKHDQNRNRAFRKQTRFSHRFMFVYIQKIASFKSTFGNRSESNYSMSLCIKELRF